MGKSVSIEFDDNSLKILKNVDQIHRNSLINIGLALAARTEYYKTLTGEASGSLDKVVSLDIDSIDSIDTDKDSNQNELEPKSKTKKSINWDDL